VIIRETTLLSDSYLTFARRREEAKISSVNDGASAYIGVLAKPTVSRKPDFPDIKLLIPVGLIGGLLAGLSLAFMRNFFDQTFKSLGDLDRFAGLPLIFSISYIEDKKELRKSHQSLFGTHIPGKHNAK